MHFRLSTTFYLKTAGYIEQNNTDQICALFSVNDTLFSVQGQSKVIHCSSNFRQPIWKTASLRAQRTQIWFSLVSVQCIQDTFHNPTIEGQSEVI